MAILTPEEIQTVQAIKEMPWIINGNDAQVYPQDLNSGQTALLESLRGDPSLGSFVKHGGADSNQPYTVVHLDDTNPNLLQQALRELSIERAQQEPQGRNWTETLPMGLNSLVRQ